MSRTTLRHVLVPAVALTLVLAGCGNDDGDAADPSAPATTEDTPEETGADPDDGDADPTSARRRGGLQ